MIHYESIIKKMIVAYLFMESNISFMTINYFMLVAAIYNCKNSFIYSYDNTQGFHTIIFYCN